MQVSLFSKASYDNKDNLAKNPISLIENQEGLLNQEYLTKTAGSVKSKNSNLVNSSPHGLMTAKKKKGCHKKNKTPVSLRTGLQKSLTKKKVAPKEKKSCINLAGALDTQLTKKQHKGSSAKKPTRQVSAGNAFLRRKTINFLRASDEIHEETNEGANSEEFSPNLNSNFSSKLKQVSKSPLALKKIFTFDTKLGQ